MSVIDLELTGQVIQEIEEVFERNDCNQADKVYIVQQMNARFIAEQQRQRTQDMMGKINPGELIKRVMGGNKEKE